MSTDAVGVQSLALSFPAVLRTNRYFQERQPELVARAGEKSLARAFSTPPRPPGAAEDLWARELRPYLGDPFRGTVERRVLGPGDSSLTLLHAAALAALGAAGHTPADIDLLLVSSLFPDQPGPGDAAPLAARLGLRCGAWNLEAMCVAPWIALETAAALIRAGTYRRILIATSCTYSRSVEEDDTLAFFMGDGGAALLVAASTPGPTAPAQVLATKVLNTSDTIGVFYCELLAGAPPRSVVRADAQAARRIPDTVTRYLVPACEAVLAAAGARLEDVDFFVFNTPTAWYERVFAQALGVPLERTSNCYPRTANVGTVLPLANLYWAAQAGRIRPGSLVLVFAMGYACNAVATLLRWGTTALAPEPPPPTQIQ